MVYRLNMGCHTVSPAPVWVRIPGPTTRVRGAAEYPVVGSRDPYEYWGRWHSFGNTYLICIIAQGPVLLQRSDAVKRIPANASAAFNESCAPIG